MPTSLAPARSLLQRKEAADPVADSTAIALGADKLIFLTARFVVTDPAGVPVGRLHKNYLHNVLRKRWYGLSPRLVKALAWQESGFQPHVRSGAGAWGVMQVTRQTWSYVEMVLLGRRVPRTVSGNIRVGVAFLHQLMHQFNFRERRAVAAYYQGARAVRVHGLYPETRAFVANVMALKRRF